MRKWCSETPPTCVSCERFDLACVHPGGPSTLPTPASDLEQNDAPATSCQSKQSLTDGQIRDLKDFMRLSSINLPEQTAVLESIHFFNARILPEVAPAHALFQQGHVAAAGWLAAPRVMQLSLAVITKAIQQSRSSAATSNDRTLLLYRGNCVTELISLVTDADVG
jgi:hypothetical protein